MNQYTIIGVFKHHRDRNTEKDRKAVFVKWREADSAEDAKTLFLSSPEAKYGKATVLGVIEGHVAVES